MKLILPIILVIFVNLETVLNQNTTVTPASDIFTGNKTLEITTTLSSDVISTSEWSDASDETTDEEGEGINIDNMSLEEVCKLYSITEENCMCSNKNMSELCDFFNLTKIDKVPRTFSCKMGKNLAMGVSNTIAAIITLVGNGLVIALTVPRWSEFSRFRHLITTLAFADFVFGFVELFMSIPQMWTCKWVYGLAMCKIMRAALSGSANISIGLIVIIAFDRYIGICRSFSKSLPKRRLWVIVWINIFVGVCSVIPPLIVLELGEFNTCTDSWGKKESKVYSWIMFIFFYLIPVLLLTIIYTYIMFFLRNAFRKNAVLNDLQQKERLRKNKKVMVMLITILLLFAILVLPNRVVWMIQDLYGLEKFHPDVNTFLKMFSDIPYVWHAAVNPIIYSCGDKKFREQLAKIFRCCNRGHMRTASYQTSTTSDNTKRATMQQISAYSNKPLKLPA